VGSLESKTNCEGLYLNSLSKIANGQVIGRSIKSFSFIEKTKHDLKKKKKAWIFPYQIG
jgi:hypothetical protein